jgi:hypothetical protein
VILPGSLSPNVSGDIAAFVGKTKIQARRSRRFAVDQRVSRRNIRMAPDTQSLNPERRAPIHPF